MPTCGLPLASRHAFSISVCSWSNVRAGAGTAAGFEILVPGLRRKGAFSTALDIPERELLGLSSSELDPSFEIASAATSKDELTNALVFAINFLLFTLVPFIASPFHFDSEEILSGSLWMRREFYIPRYALSSDIYHCGNMRLVIGCKQCGFSSDSFAEGTLPVVSKATPSSPGSEGRGLNKPADSRPNPLDSPRSHWGNLGSTLQRRPRMTGVSDEITWLDETTFFAKITEIGSKGISSRPARSEVIPLPSETTTFCCS
jgi:hypothetical protein